MIDSRNEYDYVILGSGAAGSVLAHELSDTSTVALVDVGTISDQDVKSRRVPPYINSSSAIYSPAYSGVFGGNTHLWTNKIYLISEREAREWPLMHSELLHCSHLLADSLFT